MNARVLKITFAALAIASALTGAPARAALINFSGVFSNLEAIPAANSTLTGTVTATWDTTNHRFVDFFAIISSFPLGTT